SELCADRRKRLVDGDGLVGAEVVHDEAGPALCEAGEHAADAVADVQVRLLLPTVAEHGKPGRVAATRPVEVVHVPAGVAPAEDRDDAKDDAGEVEGMAVRGDQALGCKLRGRVERRL